MKLLNQEIIKKFVHSRIPLSKLIHKYKRKQNINKRNKVKKKYRMEIQQMRLKMDWYIVSDPAKFWIEES